MDADYERLGFRCGIEIHQQLATHKLFCDCPPDIRDDSPDYTVIRRMRAVAGELGNVDPAALHEFLRDRTLCYEGYRDSTCLVELDEEPPHPVNQQALDVALEVALLLSANVVDEIHVMRKTVIDGSNTSGFQRTMLVAHDGNLETSRGPVGIPSICLEEDAARIIGEEDGRIVYRLDRLGIPLVEIATDASIRDPAHAREVAEKIGELLRQTGKVKRGLGTIRQDLNVSIARGERIEVKGVQELKSIAAIIENEVRRQQALADITGQLEKRNVNPKNLGYAFVDVSSHVKGDARDWLQKKLTKGDRAYAVALPGFAGLLGRELMPGHRFGTELSHVARTKTGVGGILHSDEPANATVDAKIKRALEATDKDAWVAVIADASTTKKALTAIVDRARAACTGVPEETRQAAGGKSVYMRPLPGSARMYPETDAPVIVVEEKRIAELAANLPESFAEKQKRYESWGLSAEMANQMVHSPQAALFEELHEKLPDADTSVVAGILTSYPKEAEKRHGVDTSVLTPRHYEEIVQAVATGTLSSSSIPELIAALTSTPENSVQAVIEEKGLGSLSGKELETLVENTVTENKDFVSKMGAKALGPLTGKVMAKAQGRADAKAVQKLLKKRL